MTSVSDLIAPFEERWNQCEGLPEMTLLRLGILREVIKLLHSEKSRLLASGRRSEIQPVKDWESKIEQLRDQPALKGPLPELLASDKRAAKRTRLLPDHLFSFIPKERFERYDRIWESTLAAEACALGWRFFSLEAWVQIAAVEAFDRALTDQLWPHGLVLFTESAGTAPIREE
ncbi:MAG: hypothetical protein ACXWOH_05375, partial [Bdellovibrionota bacterium]